MGTLFVIIAGSLWGAMGIFVRGLAGAALTSIEICLVRMIVSTVLLTLFLLITNKEALKIKIKDIWIFIGAGIFSLTFFGFCYFTTIQMTSMSVAAVLLYTSPVFVMLLSALFFREKITKRNIICVAIALIGCIFVTGIIGEGLNLPIMGILFGLGSGLGYGLYSIFSRFAINKGYGPYTITFYSFLFSSIALLFITKPGEVVSKLMVGNIGSNMLYVIGTSVIVTVLPYMFYTKGLTMIENTKAAVMACIEPIMATVFGFIVFKEVLSIYEIIGIVLVLTAIALLK
ncbi:MAG: DMT family transporter [Lachnospiraceae bacterium]|nr:DMT family transporter [Lachnospiraceae bacterium]